jgi:uncharacterized Zn finger protein
MGPDGDAQVEIICPSCWDTITLSVQQARRDMATKCRRCGTSVSLGTKTVQDEADEAERAWLAEREARDRPTP